MPLTLARSFAAGCLALLGGLASAAFAGTPADFNREDVLDTITLVSGRRHHIVQITFSGPDRLVNMSLSQHLSALVAADVDRDGLTDLAGTSKRRGLLIWKNLGGKRFVRVRRHIVPRFVPHERGTVTLESGGHRVGHDSPGDGLVLATTTGDSKHVELPSVTALLPVPLASIRPRLTRLLLFEAVFGRSTGPRAPPVRSL